MASSRLEHSGVLRLPTAGELLFSFSPGKKAVTVQTLGA